MRVTHETHRQLALKAFGVSAVSQSKLTHYGRGGGVGRGLGVGVVLGGTVAVAVGVGVGVPPPAQV